MWRYGKHDDLEYMKLNWKKKWLDDKSGSWYSAKVTVIGWEYIVEDNTYGGWEVGLYLSKIDSEVAQISSKDYKTKEKAMEVCEKHLTAVAEKFMTWTQK